MSIWVFCCSVATHHLIIKETLLNLFFCWSSSPVHWCLKDTGVQLSEACNQQHVFSAPALPSWLRNNVLNSTMRPESGTVVCAARPNGITHRAGDCSKTERENMQHFGLQLGQTARLTMQERSARAKRIAGGWDLRVNRWNLHSAQES